MQIIGRLVCLQVTFEGAQSGDCGDAVEGVTATQTAKI